MHLEIKKEQDIVETIGNIPKPKNKYGDSKEGDFAPFWGKQR